MDRADQNSCSPENFGVGIQKDFPGGTERHLFLYFGTVFCHREKAYNAHKKEVCIWENMHLTRKLNCRM